MEKIGNMHNRLRSLVETTTRQPIGHLGESPSRSTTHSEQEPSLSEPPSKPQRLDRYVIIEVLNSGGQGIVYRAHDPVLRRDVAIKVGRVQVTDHSTDYSRILNEGTLLARLDHPHLPTVYDSGIHDQHPFLVLELIEGTPLSAVVRSTPPSRKQAIRWIQEIASAVQASHQAGILHLDLKPENVLVTPEGRCKLIDFGLGWSLNRQEFLPYPITMGTPGYLAPEQQRGDSHQWTEATDVYGLGGILHFLLHGAAPSSPDNDLHDSCSDDQIPGSQTPRNGKPCRLTLIAQKARCIDPCDRFPNVQAFSRSITSPRRVIDRVLAILCMLTGILSLVLGMATNTSLLGSEQPGESLRATLKQEADFVHLDLLVRTSSGNLPALLLWTPSNGVIPFRGLKRVPEEDHEGGFAWRPWTPRRSLIANLTDPICCIIYLNAPIDDDRLQQLIDQASNSSAFPSSLTGFKGVSSSSPELSPLNPDSIPFSVRSKLGMLQLVFDRNAIPFSGQVAIRTKRDHPRWDIQMVFPTLDSIPAE